MHHPAQGADMLGLKTKFVGVILAASMVFASAASTMTMAEYKAQDRREQARYTTVFK